MWKPLLVAVLVLPMITAACAGSKPAAHSTPANPTAGAAATASPSPSERPTSPTSLAAVALPTYAPSYFSGGRACGGVGLVGLKVEIGADRLISGFVVNPSSPDKILSGPLDLVWPLGYSLEASPTGWEIVSPDRTRVIPDGTIIADVGVCPEPGPRYFIWGDYGDIARP